MAVIFVLIVTSARALSLISRMVLTSARICRVIIVLVLTSARLILTAGRPERRSKYMETDVIAENFHRIAENFYGWESSAL